ncbi:hypothetical protein AB1Y20_004284 [Prymnesium parvum]|uniref:Uncharacterized protein n=1 Tax=Prymnesium parvum TaxID=97485 RepID=A0AB34IYK1_PRYPA
MATPSPSTQDSAAQASSGDDHDVLGKTAPPVESSCSSLSKTIRLQQAEIRRLHQQLGHAQRAVQAAHDDAHIQIAREVDLRRKAERQAKHFNSLQREMRMWREDRVHDEHEEEASDQELEEEAEEQGTAVAAETAEAQVDGVLCVHTEPMPDGSKRYARSRRSLIASELYNIIRHLETDTAGDILSRLAQRLRCVPQLLQTDGMHRYMKQRDLTILGEVRDHMNNMLSTSVWTQWQHLAHVSTGKIMQLRVATGYNREIVYDSCDEDDEGTEILTPKSMHPDYEFPIGPKFFAVPTKAELEREHALLRDNESAVHKELCNGKKGASMSLTAAILKLIFEANDKRELMRCGQVPDGEAVGEYTIFFLKAGDGFGGKGVGDKIVRGGVSLLSQTGFNCSPHDWLDIFGYGGGEEHRQIELVMSDIILELQAIERAGGYVEGDGGEKYHISLLLGGDKPWQLEIAGKLNMNSTHPWIECLCTQEEGVRLDQPLDTHNVVDAERACENGGRWVTQASMEKQEEKFCELAPKPQARARRDAARDHFCFKFGKTSPFRWLKQSRKQLQSNSAGHSVIVRPDWKRIFRVQVVRRHLLSMMSSHPQTLNLRWKPCNTQ